MCPGGGVLDGRIVRTEGELRAALDPDALPFLLVRVAVALPAERLDEKLHPVHVLVFVIAEAMEDAYDGLGDVEEIAGGRELVEQVARPAHGRRATPTVIRNPSSAPPFVSRKPALRPMS